MFDLLIRRGQLVSEDGIRVQSIAVSDGRVAALIADGDEPYEPRGCPFQAWSLGEFLRLERSVLAEPASQRTGRSTARGLRQTV